MFDFEKLDVYKKAKMFNFGFSEFIKNTRLDSATREIRKLGAIEVFVYELHNFSKIGECLLCSS